MDLDRFFEENNEEQEFTIDFRRYLRGVYKRKWIVLGLFLLITIPWLLYLKSQPPEYEAYTWIRFKNYDPDKLRSLNNSRYIELTSRTFAEKVVGDLGLAMSLTEEEKKHGLMRQDVFAEFFTNLEPKPGNYVLSFTDSTFTLFQLQDESKNRTPIVSGNLAKITEHPYSVNGFTFRIKPELPFRNKEVSFHVDWFRNVVKWFQSRIQVSMGRGGTMMRIRMVHDNPEIVAQMVNSLAEIFVEESISIERKNANKKRKALQEQLKFAEEQLKRDQEALKQFQKSHPISLDLDIKNNVTKLAALETRKQDLESNVQIAEDFLVKLGETGKRTITPGQKDSEIRFIYTQLVANPLFKNDATMGILSQQLAEATKSREKLLEQKFGVSHKRVIDIDKDIVEIQKQILQTVRRLLLQTDDEIRKINARIAGIHREISNLPEEKQQMATLENQVEISQKLYDQLKLRWNEFLINDSVETEEIDILDRAIPPEYPVNRSKKRNAAFGTIFAIFFSLGVAAFLEFMDKTVKTPEDIKRYLKLNVIGSIPKVEFDNEYELKDSDKLKRIDSQLVTYDYSPTPIGEAYRALRTKIVFSKQTGRIRSLVISSFAPGDGKSFTSANLAVTLAQHKSNTLLVDSDLRRGVLHNTFGIPKEPGFSNYLIGMVRFEDIIQETYVPNLSLISCGSMMPNPSELLGSIQLRRFVEEAKKRYDIIIFDSPPLNAATDSVVLGTQSDGVILIVRADVTNRNVARQKLDLFENVPANVIGVILNGTHTELAHEGYSYYHY